MTHYLPDSLSNISHNLTDSLSFIMPNKNDQRTYQWPKGKDQMWFRNRVDKFPNGTTLTAYPSKVLEQQVHHSLDKLASAQIKK